MNHRSPVCLIAIVLAALLATANFAFAQEPLGDRLIGKWNVDPDQTAQAMKEAGATDEDIEAHVSQVRGFAIEFSQDKRFAIQMSTGEEMSGTWKVKSENKEKQQIKLSLAAGGVDEPAELTCTLSDMNSRLRIVPDDDSDRPVVFARERKPKNDDGQ